MFSAGTVAVIITFAMLEDERGRCYPVNLVHLLPERARHVTGHGTLVLKQSG